MNTPTNEEAEMENPRIDPLQWLYDLAEVAQAFDVVDLTDLELEVDGR